MNYQERANSQRQKVEVPKGWEKAGWRMESYCFMGRELLFVVMRKLRKQMVVMVAQDCECN